MLDQDGVHSTQDKCRLSKRLWDQMHLLQQIRTKFVHKVFSPMYPSELEWSTVQEQAFQIAKDALQEDSLLVHYNMCSWPVCFTVWPWAVLSHVMEGHHIHLCLLQKGIILNYKLVTIFAVEKFHNYLFGFSFGRRTVSKISWTVNRILSGIQVCSWSFSPL